MKKSTLYSLIILLASLLLDQGSKHFAKGLSTLHFNQGFIMGVYADLPDSMRVVALGAFAGFIFFFYMFLMFVIPYSAKVLKFGLSFLVGGIFGNVVDKIIYGGTIDFIPFHWNDFYVVFNVADILQWIGVLLILWIVFRKDKLIWFPDSTRQNYLINPKDQFRVALNYTAVAFSTSVMLGIFSFAFFRTVLSTQEIAEENLMLSYFYTYLILTLLFCAMSFLTGIIISHRSAGPLYAFEQYLDHLMEGRDRKLNLRDKDHYKHLEQVADKLRVHFGSDDKE